MRPDQMARPRYSRFSSTDKGAMACLVICAGNVTQAVTLACSKSQKVKFKGNVADTVEDTGDDFEQRIVFTVNKHAKNPVCQITLFLAVERDAEEDGGSLLAIDSLDLGFDSDSKATFAK